ncbi:MAG: carboxypeptidase-like regulatory domain-containing protein [Bacteroidetes bacterium]|nr:carboxypeptidase-like regulatory domain-containing protein [Bacteroidota bacterium]
MKSDLKINIPKPCGEKFEDFSPRPEGGFCGACQTTVIDFSQKSDAEIKAFFENNSKKVCGRFHKEQLRTYPSQKEVSFWGRRLALFSIPLLSLLPFSELKAQVKPKPAPVEQQSTETSEEIQINKKEGSKGKVVDASSGETIPFANVFIPSERIGCSTDLDGNFQFPHSLKKGDTIQVTFIGYEKNSFVVQDAENIVVKMDSSNAILGGLVVVGEVSTPEVHKSNSSLWRRFKAMFQ